MSVDAREERLARRVDELYSNDRQFAAARPNEAVTSAIDQPGVRLAEIMRTVMERYADRPALGFRVGHLVKDPETGRMALELLPRFATISYRELWVRVSAVASALAQDALQPRQRVCVLGFTSVDYATLDMAVTRIGAVSVPLQIGASVAQLRAIVAETEPSLIAARIDRIADAVELVLTGYQPRRLLVLDYHHDVDEQRALFTAARSRLAEAGSRLVVETLADVIRRGNASPAVPVIVAEDDPLTLLIYTSGSSGTPKGAMYPERLVAKSWLGPATAASGQQHSAVPLITLSFMPMSHAMGRGQLYGTLGAGGTVYFAATSDLSTLLEDLALVRPTHLNFVPRIWEMLRQEFRSELERRLVHGADRMALEAQLMAEQRQNILGGRYISAVTASAAISAELKAFIESYLDLHLVENYGATEIGGVLADGHVRRPQVIDYQLADVPELGYFHADQPHPRGELLVKSNHVFAGYYRRPQATAAAFTPEGYFRTGDIVAEVGPDHLVYLDRRSSVIKLSQGEFVTVSQLEAVFVSARLVRQIYIYGHPARAYLLAVVVPTADALARNGGDIAAVKPLIADSLQHAAATAGLQPYEMPRDFIVETTPFTPENGLLTDVGKLARPTLTRHYRDRLEQLYAALAQCPTNELRALRQGADNQPVLRTVTRAASALLGTAHADLPPDTQFIKRGGDSLSALRLANLLQEIFDTEVPVSAIVNPAADLQAIADYIDAAKTTGRGLPTFAAVHGPEATHVHTRDLTLNKFLAPATLAAAQARPRAAGEVRTVLLTGATGFLGRYPALEWLQRLSPVDGTLICLVRARNDASARERLNKIFDGGDPKLLAHYRELAADNFDVIAGDKDAAYLGVTQQTWRRLADSVDLIVDNAALVNHVLPYRHHFNTNTRGTAELIRVALTSKLKRFGYVSTIGVGTGIEPASAFNEDADVRVISATRKVDASYANGYLNSKWAGEVLLREAHDLCGLPVAVFRCSMILADTKYVGQLNLPDKFTRLMFSLLATGIAPASFYQIPPHAKRHRAHYDGLPVDFIAEAISTLAEQLVDQFETYHVINPHDDGIGLDEYVDWLIGAGYSIQRIPEYDEWLQRFETALRALPAQQRQHSLLPLLHSYRKPHAPACAAAAQSKRFRSAVQHAAIGVDNDIPHVSPPTILKYGTNLQLLGLL
jgi:fatty acid CoA ligase FadD9